MSQHKYKEAYNEGFKDGKEYMADYLLCDRLSSLIYEEPNEKQEGYNEAITEVMKMIKELKE